jgi:hypothetical protein
MGSWLVGATIPAGARLDLPKVRRRACPACTDLFPLRADTGSPGHDRPADDLAALHDHLRGLTMPDAPKTVDQPGWPPTNKLLYGVGSTMLTNIILRLLEQQGLTSWLGDDVTMLREFVFLLISGALGWAVGYFVRDKPNQPALVAALKEEINATPGAVMPAIAREPEGD